VKAMLLAAGQGTRLRPLTHHMPKALIPVAGRPMIEYPLLLLRHYGIREIMINLHHFGEQIENELGTGEQLGLDISYSEETELLDTGGGLLKAKPFLQDETFIVINTDALIDLDLASAITFHKHKNSAVTLILRPDADADSYGSIDIDSRAQICRFLATQAPSPSLGPICKLMFSGVQILEPTIFEYMAGMPQKFSTTRETYPKMLTAGAALYGFRFDGFWQDLGTAERIKQAEAKLARGEASLHYL
jgi:NDP-sugar pyrophosphorylase family protein